MGEILFAIVAAIVTIVIAGLLVNQQNKREKVLKELSDELLKGLGEAATEYYALTGEEPSEHSIDAIEKDMIKLNKRLHLVKSHKKEPNHHVKRKKNSPND